MSSLRKMKISKKVIFFVIIAIAIILLFSTNPSEENGLFLLLLPIALFATPVLFVYVIYSITSKTLTATGASDQPDATGNKPFLGKNSKKTFIISLTILLLAGVVMFLNLHKYY
jgi:uncharacterized membrane protein